MAKTGKENNSFYEFLHYALERMEGEKAKELLEKIESFETNDEFSYFYWNLNAKALLNSF